MHLLTKGCPRCGGDLSRVNDVGETYYSCVQCGHSVAETVARRAAAVRLPLTGPLFPRAA